MGESGKDAAVAILLLRQVELQENVAYMSLNRALAEVKPLRDAHVR